MLRGEGNLAACEGLAGGEFDSVTASGGIHRGLQRCECAATGANRPSRARRRCRSQRTVNACSGQSGGPIGRRAESRTAWRRAISVVGCAGNRSFRDIQAVGFRRRLTRGISHANRETESAIAARSSRQHTPGAQLYSGRKRT